MPEKHSHEVPGGRAWWWTETLWRASAELPIFEVDLVDIAELDRDCWFLDRRSPTIRAVAEHARRIEAADLTQPVILSDGRLMDGGHRLAKALLLGLEKVPARRFETDPEPDWFEPMRERS